LQIILVTLTWQWLRYFSGLHMQWC